MVGHQLAQSINLAIAHLQDAAGIAQHRARLQLAEGDDLRDVIVAVLCLDIADHLAAPGFAEVDVEIGHRHAFGVQEPLKQQPQLERIEVSDGQRPRHHAARARAAPWAHRNVLLLGPLDEIGHDQEVSGKAHTVDHVDLEFEAIVVSLAVVGGQFSIRFEPLGKASARILGHFAGFTFLIAGQAGQNWLAFGRQERAALRDHQRVGDGLGQIREQFLHHRRRLDPPFARRPWPVSAVDMRGAGDAQHRIVRGIKMRIGVTGGIGRDQRQISRIRKIDQRFFRR